MKKIALFFAGVAFVASLSSCKHDYTCTCTDSGATVTVDLNKMSKKDAESACDVYATGGYSCSLEKK